MRPGDVIAVKEHPMDQGKVNTLTHSLTHTCTAHFNGIIVDVRIPKSQ